jgi:hypothetical protein
MADWRSVTGKSSENVERWRLVQNRNDARAEMNMRDIVLVDDLYQRATDFMHQGGLRMDEDYVGKPQDIYLWCLISESKAAGVWVCLRCFKSGSCAVIRITEKGRYLTLEFCGKHHPRCHDELLMDGRNSARRGMDFMPCLSSEDGKDDVGSGKHHVDFITCYDYPCNLPYSDADGHHGHIGRSAAVLMICRFLRLRPTRKSDRRSWGR